MKIKWVTKAVYLMQGQETAAFIIRSKPFLWEDKGEFKEEESIVGLDVLAHTLTNSLFCKEFVTVSNNGKSELQIDIEYSNGEHYTITNDNLKEYRIINYFTESENKPTLKDLETENLALVVEYLKELSDKSKKETKNTAGWHTLLENDWKFNCPSCKKLNWIMGRDKRPTTCCYCGQSVKLVEDGEW